MHKQIIELISFFPVPLFCKYFHLPHKVASIYLCSHFIFRNRRLQPDFHLHTYNSATNSFGFIDSWMFLFRSIASRTSSHTLIPTSIVPVQVMLRSKMAKLMKAICIWSHKDVLICTFNCDLYLIIIVAHFFR